jgi:hydroxymethylpyrimidine pyrophosphatase-like HAD family hydrolase
MRIALDYDDTYTNAPELFDDFISMALDKGHDIRIVTARHFELDKIVDEFDIPIIYCNGVAKAWWCHHYESFDPDVWVDDKPKAVYENSSASKEWLADWRATRES